MHALARVNKNIFGVDVTCIQYADCIIVALLYQLQDDAWSSYTHNHCPYTMVLSARSKGHYNRHRVW